MWWTLRRSTVSESVAAGEQGEQRVPGVYKQSWGTTWFAQIRHKGKLHYLGSFPSQSDAAEAVSQARLAIKQAGSPE